MLRPTRPLPHAGSRVRLIHFGGEVESATILAVHDGGRRLEVGCIDGERAEFVLSEATAKFVAVGWADGMRLQMLDEGELN
ncbi:MAG TPA: hypothetical protein VGF95_09860 [Solirubrobacteraceae bacterium]